MSVRSPSLRVPMAVLVAVLSASCGDDATSSNEAGGDLDTAYVLGTRVWDDSSTTSYFHVAPSLEQTVQVDPARALEVSGAAKLYAAYDLGWFAFGEGESPTLSRYTLDDEGRLKKGASISLQQYGVKGLWDTIYFVSPTKAYYPDRDGAQLIVWNPTSMEVTDVIALPQTAREGYLANYGYAAIERAGKLLITVGWFDWNETDSVLPATGLLVVDTTTDEVVSFEVDERCGGVTQPITTASGDTMLVSSALAAAAHRLERLATAPCALRIRAGSDAIDTEYLTRLGELTGGALSGEPVAGAGDALFLRVFDEELASTDKPMLTWELTGQPAWRWMRWDIANDRVEPVANLAPSTSDVLWFRVDGKVYGTETAADYTTTTLIELTAEGGPRRGLTVPGFLHGVVRVR
jgi:hypothetical protein